MQILRPYQTEAVAAVWEAHDEFYNRVLICKPTGTGKTTTLSEIVKEALSRGWEVLVTAHRSEIVEQLYTRIKDHCGLCPHTEIGMEIDTVTAPGTARVICASIDSVRNPNRIREFKIRCRLLIRDEAHHAACASDKAIAKQCGVDDGSCFYIGCTATPKRGDKQSVYAQLPDGKRVTLKDKKGNEFEAQDKDCVFEKLVYEYPFDVAIEEGWIVEPRGYTVHSTTDISKVKRRGDDLATGELSKTVDNATRTLEGIQGWKDAGADNRPTIAFCVTREHAIHSADLFRKAGYTADCLFSGSITVEEDGEEETIVQSKMERFRIFSDFKAGRLQVICNVGIATEGTDLVNCGCVIHLRPTQNWGLYMQMTGRGVRPTVHLSNEWTSEQRRAAIATSSKPDLIVIDVVDITTGKDPCSVPSILDLPVKMDLQGKGVAEVQKMLKEFEEVKGQVIGECPVTYEALKVRLEAVELLRQSNARAVNEWASTETGYAFRGVRPGYSVQMDQAGDGNYKLTVKGPHGVVLYEKEGKPGADFKDYLNSAQKHAQAKINAHIASQPQPSRGTLKRLTEKQARVLRIRGHEDKEIDSMPYAMAKGLIDKYMSEYKSRQPSTFSEGFRPKGSW